MSEEISDKKMLEIAMAAVKAAEDRKAEGVTLYDVSGSSLIADYYLICTANSEPHIKATINAVEKELKVNYNLTARNIDGKPASRWMIIDFPNILVHVLHSESRDHYHLEDLWTEGTQIYPELPAETTEDLDS
jgi:ribosome-associated protein